MEDELPANHFWRFGDAQALQKLINLLKLYHEKLSSLERQSGRGATTHLGSRLAFYDKKHQICQFPDQGSSEEEILAELLDGGQLTDWASTTNGVGPCSPATLLAIFGALLCAHQGPNLGWQSFSRQFGPIEQRVTSMLCDLIGFKWQDALGVSTYGGAGGILYGIKVGIARAARNARIERGSLRVLRTAGAHFSTDKAAHWLGLGDNAVIDVRAKNGRMDPVDLKACLDNLLSTGGHIGCIITEVGSTYDFAIDDIAEIRAVCDNAMQIYSLPYDPFIHADAAVGGIYLVFRDYDVSTNNLQIHDLALKEVSLMQQKLQSVRLADSVSIDFHKLGFSPLISTMFILKHSADATPLMSFQAKHSEGSASSAQPRERLDPVSWTLEASRTATGALSAYMNCLLLGKRGYREYLGQMLWLSATLRSGLEREPFCKIMNTDHGGPSLVMRWYPDNASRSLEKAEGADVKTRARVDKFNQALFDCYETIRQSVGGLELGMAVDYEVRESGDPWTAACLKACLASPNIAPQNISATLECLQRSYAICTSAAG